MTSAITVPVVDDEVDRLISTRVHALPRTDGLLALHAQARDRTAGQAEFVRSTRRIMRLLIEDALGRLRHQPRSVTTPIGAEFVGCRRAKGELFAVSVPRAGDALEAELRDVCPETRVGKILIQRDPVTKQPSLYYSKLPEAIADQEVLLLDPMMATAGTALMAVDILMGAGVREGDVLLVNMLTCPSALATLLRWRPQVRVVTSFVDERLTPEAFMYPGIGDFGDRFYGTSS